jgi:hypothetical protein
LSWNWPIFPATRLAPSRAVIRRRSVSLMLVHGDRRFANAAGDAAKRLVNQENRH